jgi:hypothetical protein
LAIGSPMAPRPMTETLDMVPLPYSLTAPVMLDT